MEAGTWGTDEIASQPPPSRAAWTGPSTPNLLRVIGAFLLLAGVTYGILAVLRTRLIEQERFLVGDDVLPLSIPDLDLASTLAVPALRPSGFGLAPQPGSGAASRGAVPGRPRNGPTATPPAQPAGAARPSPTPPAAAPVRIRIPRIGVNRAIIELPAVRDRRTGNWTRNVKRLFRTGRKDLVGHWGGSAYPGQEGNTILVGHNYGYGSNGVFLRLGRLRAGHKVQVVNKDGEVFTYRVTEVKRVRWRRKSSKELMAHATYLSVGGPERLTLVTCSGSKRAPFPERVYVVAEPVR